MKTALLVFALMSYGVVYSQVQESCQVTTPPMIDGKMDDWQGDWKTDEDSKFQYNVCFDAENLYVRVKTSDEMNQGKMGRFGFTVWLDANGKKKRKLGLKYPTPTGRDFSTLPHNQGQTENQNRDIARTEMRRNLIKDTEVLELIGLAKENVVSSRVGLMNGIEVIIVMDETGAYVYEAKIPFKAYRLSKASIPVLGVGFETGKLEAQKAGGTSGGGGQRQGGSGGHGGSRGYGGSGYGGGSRQGGSARYSEMQKAASLWVSVKLN